MRLSHADPRKLVISPLNMHFDEPAPDVSDIIGSVRQHGVLETLLVRETFQDGVLVPEHFEVVAGRRRCFAAQAVAGEGIDIDPVPIGILEPGDDAAALEISLIENMARLPPNEVACWETFVKLIREGRTPEYLAATYGKTEAVIHRVLALGNLLPRIRKLYRKEAIDVATVRQLTLASKSQQKDWLKLYDDPGQREPRGASLKAWLFGGEAIPTSLAIFALEDYPGAIIADLFGEEAYFTDAALFWTHQNQAVAAKVEALRGEGWSDVEVMEVGQTFYGYQHVAVPKAKGGKVFIAVSRRGEVTVHEGWLTTKDARRAEAAARAAAQGGDGAGGLGAGGEGGGKAERSEVTANQQAYIDLHRRAAVRAVLTDHLDVALRLLVAHAVAGEVPHHPVPEALGVLLDHASDDVDLPARGHGPDAADHRLVGAFGEQPRLLVDLADEERGAVVAVDAVLVGGDVDLDEVALPQHGRVRDAVADHLVDRGAQRLEERHLARVRLVPQRRRVRAVVADELVPYAVELVGGDARCDVPPDLLEGLGRDPARDPDPLDRLGVLHLRAGERQLAVLAHVLRSLDGRGDGPDRAEGARDQRALRRVRGRHAWQSTDERQRSRRERRERTWTARRSSRARKASGSTRPRARWRRGG